MAKCLTAVVAYNTVLLGVLTLSTIANAHQPVDGDIWATFGPFTYMSQEMHHEYSQAPLVSPGLVAEGDIDALGGLEISLFYLRNVFSLEQDGKIIAERVKRIYITTGWRFWFTKKFSVAGAWFSSYTIGDARVIRDDFPPGEAPGTSARETMENGIDVSIQYEPWHDDRFALVLDGRYSYSLTAKSREDTNHFGLFVGIKYFVQSREQALD